MLKLAATRRRRLQCISMRSRRYARHQIGLPALLSAVALVSLWFGWAETVDNVVRANAAHEQLLEASEAPPPVVVLSAP
jgi:hypothetical protein